MGIFEGIFFSQECPLAMVKVMVRVRVRFTVVVVVMASDMDMAIFKVIHSRGHGRAILGQGYNHMVKLPWRMV